MRAAALLVLLCAMQCASASGPKNSSECGGVGVYRLDVSIPLEPTGAQLVAIFYSFSVWTWVLSWMLGAACTRRPLLISGSCWILVSIGLNELVFKQLLGSARPAGSCLTTNGMPSSHALISMGMCVWLVLEVLFHQCVEPAERAGCIVALLLALPPVLPSRVALHDHSVAQVAVGGLLGIVLGVVHFALMHTNQLPAPCTGGEEFGSLRVAAEVKRRQRKARKTEASSQTFESVRGMREASPAPDARGHPREL